ncbi:MAG: NUDIX hydrolase [Bdellovibrionales bacterium]|nr:NUDIX hydrolase [Bdellovibrionales bacterium]
MPHKRKPWTIESSKHIIQDRWVSIRADTCRSERDLEISPYYIFEYSPWVCIFPLTEDGKLLITEQYRHGIGQVLFEFPGGGVDSSDSSPLEAARRELLEETGYTASEFIELGDPSTDPAKNTNRLHFYLAKDARKIAEQQLETTEDISLDLIEIEEVFSLMDRGLFLSARQMGGLLLLLRYLNLPIPPQRQ